MLNSSRRSLFAAFECKYPPPPVNGLVDFGRWAHGQYAKISCKDPDRYAFATEPQKFYKCDSQGIWQPNTGDPFRFPACAGISCFSSVCLV